MRCHKCGVQKSGRGRCQSCGATVNKLTDMDFDEISFVRRGANQRAHVVLWKSSEEGNDMAASTYELLDAAADRYPDLPTPQAIAKVLDETPGLYSPDTPPPSWQEPIAKTVSTWEIQKQVFIDHGGEELSPQEVLEKLTAHPELYQ
jgi:hypothetical protein